MCRKKPIGMSGKPLANQPRQQHELVVMHPHQVVRAQHLHHRLRKDAVHLLVFLPVILLVARQVRESNGTAARASCCRSRW